MRSILAGLRTLVLPWGAGPGTPRIVAGPDVPPELQAFYNVGLARMTSVIVWYYGNATNTYHYYGVVDLGGGVPPGNVVRGDVLTGGVFPMDTYVGNSWLVFRNIANANMTTKQSTNSNLIAGFTNTTYSTANSCGHSFTCPPSGGVICLFRSRFKTNTAGVSALVSTQLRDGNVVGSGTIISAASDVRALEMLNANNKSAMGSWRLFLGLTSGNDYNVQMLYRMDSAGNGDILDQGVLTIPWIGSAA